jgi:MFS family permease
MNQGTNAGERVLVAIMFVTWGVVFLDRMALPYLAPYIAPDLKLTGSQIGNLVAMMSICWAVSALVFGALSDRIGRKVVLVPMVVLFSLLSILSGFAHSFVELLIVRGLLGVAEGPCWSIIMAFVEERSTPVHRGRNIGIVASAAAIIGLAVAPVLTTQIAALFGWRWAFFIAAVPGFVMALLIALFTEEENTGASRQPGQRVTLRDMASLLGYRNIWVSALGAAGFMAWTFLFSAFGPLYITEVERQAGTTAGFLMGAAGLGSFIIGLLGPALSDRFGRRPVLAVQAILCTILPLALMVHPLYSYLWVLAGILFLTQAGQAIAAICIVLVPTDSVPRNLAGSAIGLTTLAGELVGGFIAPIAAGTLVAEHGLAAPLWIASAGAAVVFVSALLMASPPKAG